jgi:hypothetical protein
MYANWSKIEDADVRTVLTSSSGPYSRHLSGRTKAVTRASGDEGQPITSVTVVWSPLPGLFSQATSWAVDVLRCVRSDIEFGGPESSDSK